MLKLTTTLALLFVATIFSCSNKQHDNTTAAQTETPKALQNESVSGEIFSKTRYSGNMVDELYKELVEKSAELKTLESSLDALPDKTTEENNKFAAYDQKSQDYYSSTNIKLRQMDTLLHAKMEAMINASKERYKNKIAELNSLLVAVSNNNSSLQGHHAAMQLALTLPLIEKYQDDKLPSKKELQKLVQEQKKLMAQLDNYIK